MVVVVVGGLPLNCNTNRTTSTKYPIEINEFSTLGELYFAHHFTGLILLAILLVLHIRLVLDGEHFWETSQYLDRWVQMCLEDN